MNLSRFESLGVYMPPREKTTKQVVAEMTNPPAFDVEEITGIKTRRVRGDKEDSLDIALKAATVCLKNSRYEAKDIDIVISTSIARNIGENGSYKYFYEPSFSHMLKNKMEMYTANNFDLSNACAGLFSGIYVLDAMIKSGVVKTGMVVSGECITSISETAQKEITEPFDPQFGSLTVGDAGAAVILDRAVDDEDYIEQFEIMTCAEYSDLCLGMPSDQRNGYALYTNNSQMHKEERVRMWPVLKKSFLDKSGESFEDRGYDYIVQHQVGNKAVRHFNKVGEKFFETPMPEDLSVVERFGNTATTSHIVVLYHHIKEGTFKLGSKILLIPAASGLVTGFLSAKITNLEV